MYAAPKALRRPLGPACFTLHVVTVRPAEVDAFLCVQFGVVQRNLVFLTGTLTSATIDRDATILRHDDRDRIWYAPTEISSRAVPHPDIDGRRSIVRRRRESHSEAHQTQVLAQHYRAIQVRKRGDEAFDLFEPALDCRKIDGIDPHAIPPLLDRLGHANPMFALKLQETEGWLSRNPAFHCFDKTA